MLMSSDCSAGKVPGEIEMDKEEATLVILTDGTPEAKEKIDRFLADKVPPAERVKIITIRTGEKRTWVTAFGGLDLFSSRTDVYPPPLNVVVSGTRKQVLPLYDTFLR